jgi:hypothetical protein
LPVRAATERHVAKPTALTPVPYVATNHSIFANSAYFADPSQSEIE